MTIESIKNIPIVPLSDVVVFPHMITPLLIDRIESIKALECCLTTKDEPLFVVTKKSPDIARPALNDLYRVGVYATVLQVLRLPDNNLRVLIEGKERAYLQRLGRSRDYLSGTIQRLEEEGCDRLHSKEMLERFLALRISFSAYVEYDPNAPEELLAALEEKETYHPDNLGRILDMIAMHTGLPLAHRQQILSAPDLSERLDFLLEFLEVRLEMLKIDKRVKHRIQKKVEEKHRRFYLMEKMEALRLELAKMDGHDAGVLPGGAEEGSTRFSDMEKKIRQANMSPEAAEKARAEYKKLQSIPPISSEATVIYNYLDCLLNVPWNRCTNIKRSLKKAGSILEENHYGLEKVKERILEYLSVQRRVKERNRGVIFCLVGPPGVGKTSLGQSIAHAMGRKFIRVSLGGVRDEAEIRGHRRTYVGAMPGRIIQKLIKVKVANPLFMLDEIDKMSTDFRGDPSAALLEVLDPEQNKAFDDHYLDVSYDLSRIMFIATANTLNIPPALLDRMEVIRLPGYTEQEKCLIGNRYLLPKQLERHGLTSKHVGWEPNVLTHIIRYYTREAGLRNLERAIAKLSRKVVYKIAKEAITEKITIGTDDLDVYLGAKKYRHGLAHPENRTGCVNGLSWSETGGDLLTIEAVHYPGRGKLIYTGSLGDIMQESIQAAVTVVRSYSQALGLTDQYFQQHDIHIHVPEGAIPKDGPSAGIAISTAVMSMVSKVSVCADIAMTGEINLQGEVLQIGGLKEKLLAALRGGIVRVLIPRDNKKDLIDMPKEVMDQLKILPVSSIEEVWGLALEIHPLKRTGRSR